MALTPTVRRSTGTVRSGPSPTKKTATSGKPSTTLAKPYVTGGGTKKTVKSSPTKSAPESAYKKAPSATKSAPKSAYKAAPKDAYKKAPSDAYKKAPSDAYKKAPSDAYKKAPKDALKKAPKGSSKTKRRTKKAARRARSFGSRTTSTTESGMSLAQKVRSTPRSRAIGSDIRMGGMHSLRQPTRGKSSGHAKRSARRSSIAAGHTALGAAEVDEERGPVRFVGKGDTAKHDASQIGPKEQTFRLAPRATPRGGRAGITVGDRAPRAMGDGFTGSTGIGHRQHTEVSEADIRVKERGIDTRSGVKTRRQQAMEAGRRIFEPRTGSGLGADYGMGSGGVASAYRRGPSSGARAKTFGATYRY